MLAHHLQPNRRNTSVIQRQRTGKIIEKPRVKLEDTYFRKKWPFNWSHSHLDDVSFLVEPPLLLISLKRAWLNTTRMTTKIVVVVDCIVTFLSILRQRSRIRLSCSPKHCVWPSFSYLNHHFMIICHPFTVYNIHQPHCISTIQKLPVI